MKHKHTVETIQNDLREISEVVEGFKKSENIRAIDIDIVISKVQNLYDLLLLIKKASTESIVSPTQNKKVEEKKPIIENKVIEEPVIEDKHARSSGGEDIVFDEESVPQIKEEPVAKEEVKDKVNVEDKTPEIIAEKYQSKENSINESIGQNHSTLDLSSRIQSKPIKDLSESIGLNDKFLFQKVLFKGDKIKYAETIDKLNEIQNFDDALSYIQSNFDWAPNNEAADKLLELVRRKFW